MSRGRLVLKDVSVFGDADRSQTVEVDESSDGTTVRKKRLDSVSCSIEAGKLTLLVGSIGSGKSTLLDVLGGLILPDVGSVRVSLPTVQSEFAVHSDAVHSILTEADSLEDYRFPGQEARSAIGMMFQFPEQQLFARTVQGEFDYSLRPLRLPQQQAAAQTAEALREVGLDGGTLPLHPFALSGGQQRRVAMATTLATAPGWLLLDEASAGLDAEGIHRLAQQLRRWTRQERLGIVLATHDLETFLPLADEVLVLVRGRLAAAMSREQLLAAPAVLRQAGLVLPDRVRATAWLQARGFAAPGAVPAAGGGAGDAMSPVRFAEAVSGALRRGRPCAANAPAPEPVALSVAIAPAPEPVALSVAAAPTPEPVAPSVAAAPAPEPVAPSVAAAPAPEPVAPSVATAPAREHAAPSVAAEPAPEPVALSVAAAPAREHVAPPAAVVPAARQLDPRAVWVFCTLVSVGMLLQITWLGVVASAITAYIAIARSSVTFHAVWKVVRPFVWLTSLTVVFSGIRFIGFSIADAADTLLTMLRFLFIMAVSFLLPLQYSPLTLKRTFEQSLSPTARFGLPVQAIALYLTMLMRFIPLIQSEWGRFARIARARGRSKSKPGTIQTRDLPAIAIPLLLSLLRTADSAATALEMRGYRSSSQPTSQIQQMPTKQTPQLLGRDYVCIAVGFVFFLLLVLIRIME